MAPSRHVAIIDPGARVPELDTFNNLNALSPITLSYHQPALHGFSSLRLRETGLAGVVILGSAASVHDDLAWQDELKAWLEPKLGAGLPVLGICYGHQLIAHMMGGRVDFLFPDHRKLTGFREVALEANRLWGDALRGELVISHREAVTACPPAFTIAARSDDCAIDGMAHQSLPIWSFQPHPEATAGFMANQNISYDPARPERFAFGHQLVLRFLSFAHRNQ